MLKCLRREPADHFRTRQVSLGAEGDICAYGDALSFSDVQALRQQGVIQGTEGRQEFANLGVSLQLVVRCGDRRALVLVEQRGVLKLVSGYVPEEHLGNPLTTAWAELMEEVLPFVGEKCHGFSANGNELPDPYGLDRLVSLGVKPGVYLFEPSLSDLTFAGRESIWPVAAYVHERTASLQLIYPLEITLPEDVTLRHVEDSFDVSTGELLSVLHGDSYVILMELDGKNEPTGDWFTLQDGIWKAFPHSKLTLSEFFRGPALRLARPFLD